MADFNVTPWDASGAIDYDKLIEQFGTKKISEQLREKMRESAGGLHPMLSRGYFFSHRDLDLAIDEHRQGKGFFLYTGRGPSGPMHIGHLIPLVFTKWLQDKFKCNLYIQITDDEKYLVKQGMQWADAQKFSHENILDIIAVGFDPKRTFIFRDSEYVKNSYPLMLAVARKTTLSTAKAVFGFTDSSNIGITFYPSYQIVPTFFEKKRCLIPSAIDQDPYWRIQRDIAQSLGYFKTAAIHSKFLPPLGGIEGKMSSSAADGAIWLSDDEKAVKNKINKYAFSGGKSSIEEHRKHGGNPDIDVSYQWLKIFFEPSDAKLKRLHDEYKSGSLLSGEMKAALIEKINSFLASHREKREEAKQSAKEFTHEGQLARQMWEKSFQPL